MASWRRSPLTAVKVTVYVIKTGANHHNAGCRYLSKSSIPVHLAEARNHGNRIKLFRLGLVPALRRAKTWFSVHLSIQIYGEKWLPTMCLDDEFSRNWSGHFSCIHFER